MSAIFVGIGGSGARVAECLVHLCLAGLGPEKLTILLVDLDASNGSVTHVRELIDDYCAATVGVSRAQDVGWARTKITMHSRDAWSPLSAESGTQTLESFVELEHLQAVRPDLGLLLHSCYSLRELKQDLRGGFRAMPSIGAAVFGSTIVDHDPCWGSLAQGITAELSASAGVRVSIAGSCFGGTGAAGFPVVPRLLRHLVKDNTNKLQFGGILLLPYFAFKPPDDQDTVARSEDFTLQSQAALSYYAKYGPHLDYKRVYLIGDANRAEYESAAWGQKQRNPVNVVELLGALGCLDFQFAPPDGLQGQEVVTLARSSASEYNWSDIPKSNGAIVQRSLGHSARCALVWHGILLPAYTSWVSGARRYRRTPWIVSLIEAQGLLPREAQSSRLVAAFSRLLSRHLRWMCQLTGSDGALKAGTRAPLFDAAAVTFDDTTHSVLVDPLAIPRFARETAEPSWSGEWVLARLNKQSARHLRQQGSSGFGVFQSALWSASE
jgi:hypothetical protein